MATDFSEQIIREAPAIEAYKLGLLGAAKDLAETPLNLPAYQAAGLSDLQQQAIQRAQSGIGAYAPFLQAGQSTIEAGTGAMGAAAQQVAGVDVTPQYQQALNTASMGLGPTSAMTQFVGEAGAGRPLIEQGAQKVGQAAGMVPMGADLAGSQGLLQQAAAGTMAARPDFAQAQGAMGSGLGAAGLVGQAGLAGQQAAAGTLGMGIAGLLGGAQGYDPYNAIPFMNPFQQAVTQNTLGEMRRQADIARQGQAAQAVGAGAFGGTREGVQRAEFERNVQDQMAQRIMQDYAQNYGQAQQAAMQAFEQQQQRQLGASQGLGQAAGLQSQFGTQAANVLAQQAGLQGQLGSQLGNLEAQRAQLGLAGAGQLGDIGSQLGQQQLAQSQLGQAGASLYGQLGTQQAQLGLLPAQLASQQAAIAGQQAGLYNQLGQGIGSLAGQYGQLGLQQGQTLGQLGQGLGTLGVQQAALGESAQRLGTQDLNTLLGLGGLQQQTAQSQLDAQRATQLQQAMTPYQQTAFLSDIYKGAPSTQMTSVASSAPSTSPLLQAAGLGISGLAAATGAQKAGLFGS
jgi:hypothetical protein